MAHPSTGSISLATNSSLSLLLDLNADRSVGRLRHLGVRHQNVLCFELRLHEVLGLVVLAVKRFDGCVRTVF